MRTHVASFFIVFASVLSQADTISEADLRGVWKAQFASTYQDSMLGKLKWIRVTFLDDNKVQWTWERGGKIEEHRGKYLLSHTPVTVGMHRTSHVSLRPETMAVYRDIPLQQAVIDPDSRFHLQQRVLKCQDHEGNDLVFSRQETDSK